MKKPILERAGDFLAGKGFYIVLFLCVAAIGISGYYLFSSMQPDGPDTAVSGPAQVTVTPAPTPEAAVRPEPPAVPTPRPAIQAAATPVPAPTPVPTPAPTAPAPVTTSSVFTWPVRGELVAVFSADTLLYDETMGDWRTHTGLDIASSLGTQVLAAAGGTVTAVDQDDLMGTVVVIDHGNGLVSTYANLTAAPTVAVGDVVTTGDVIGSVGQTAIAESARRTHLHFGMTEEGEAVDPLEYLPPAR